MNLTPRQLFGQILSGEVLESFPRIIPVNPPITAIMEKSGIFWPDAHRDGRLMADLAAACHESLGFNAVNVPFDMTVEAEALGCELVWKEGIAATPQVVEGVVENEALLEFENDVLHAGRIPLVLEAVSRLRGRYGAHIPVISFLEGPFTLAGLVVGVNRMYKYLIRDPERAVLILDRLAGLAIKYATAQLASGADTVIVLDPNVMGITRPQFTEFILPVYRLITATIDVPLILHICGDVHSILDVIPDSGFAAFSFDHPAVNVASVKEALGDKMKIIGSVPTVTLLLNGTRDEVFDLSLDMIGTGVDLLAPSCFTPPEAPLENVCAMGDAIDHWNERRSGEP